MVTGLIFSNAARNSKDKCFVGKKEGGCKEVWMQAALIVALVVTVALIVALGSRENCPVQKTEPIAPTVEDCRELLNLTGEQEPARQGTPNDGSKLPESNASGTSNVLGIPNLEAMLGQKMEVISAYQEGPDLYFRVRADPMNTIAIDSRIISYKVGNLPVNVSSWSGGIDGTPCTSLTLFRPRQDCFGRILNMNCSIGDMFEISLLNESVFSREIINCK